MTADYPTKDITMCEGFDTDSCGRSGRPIPRLLLPHHPMLFSRHLAKGRPVALARISGATSCLNGGRNLTHRTQLASRHVATEPHWFAAQQLRQRWVKTTCRAPASSTEQAHPRPASRGTELERGRSRPDLLRKVLRVRQVIQCHEGPFTVYGTLPLTTQAVAAYERGPSPSPSR
jgi:hypothetical protein